MYGIEWVVGLFGGMVVLGQLAICIGKSKTKIKSKPRVIKWVYSILKKRE